MLNDWSMIIVGVAALGLAGFNLAYAFFSTGQCRSVVMVRGVICGYIGMIYVAYLADLIAEPYSMRYYMRAAIVVVIVLFGFDTVLMWRKRKDCEV